MTELDHRHVHQRGLILSDHFFKQANTEAFTFETACTMQGLFNFDIALDFGLRKFTKLDFLVFDQTLFKTRRLLLYTERRTEIDNLVRVSLELANGFFSR